jgi:dihydrofolate synthase / folylpolyglutamate synthase
MGPHAYLEGLRPLAMRFGLERMERALEALGHPERRYPVLHVAGTNGKGSTCAMAAAAIAAAGHRVGLYTTPHLVRFNERIAVDGVPVDDATLEARIGEVRRACPWHEAGGEDDRLTYFEFATLLGLLEFAVRGVGAAVVEVGLGGRLDATNAIARPAVTAVARIGLDHTQLLGDTVELVAREKAGIFKPGVPAVAHGDQPSGVVEVLRAEAARVGAPFSVAPAVWEGVVGLRGPHQRANAGLASAALRALAMRGVAVGEEAIARGIAGAVWPGRLEEVGGVLLDGAHNPQGAAALAAALAALHPGRPVELVFGVLADKDYRRMLEAVAPLADKIILTRPRSERAADPESLARLRCLEGKDFSVIPEIPGAWTAALRSVRKNDLVCGTGSMYFVGEVLKLEEGKAQPNAIRVRPASTSSH